MARQLLTPGTARTGTHRAAVVERRVVGALRVLAPTKDNPTTAVVDVAVHPDSRRRRTGTLLLAEGERLAAELGRTALLAEVDEVGPDAPGRLFALHHGWSCDLLETRRDLVLPVDRERLDRLEQEAAPHAAGYRVVTWRDRTPDDLLDDRAVLEARMSVDAPHGDLPVELEHWDGPRIREYEQMHVDRGRTVLSAGAVAPDGRLVAFTDLQVPLDDPRARDAGRHAGAAGSPRPPARRAGEGGGAARAGRRPRRRAHHHLQLREQPPDGGGQRGARVRAGGRAVDLVAPEVLAGAALAGGAAQLGALGLLLRVARGRPVGHLEVLRIGAHVGALEQVWRLVLRLRHAVRPTPGSRRSNG